MPSAVKKENIFAKNLFFLDTNSHYEKLTNSELQSLNLKQKKLKNTMSSAEDGVIELNEYDAKNDYAFTYSFNETKLAGIKVCKKISPDKNKDLDYALYFTENKTFYPDGKIKLKQVIFGGNQGNRIFLKNFEYNEEGKLINEYNISQHYKLSIADILRILEKNNLEISFNKSSGTSEAGIPPTSIKNLDTNYGKIWYISAKIDGFSAIIDDITNEIKILKYDSVNKNKVPFIVMSKFDFNNYYKGKTIEDIQNEEGTTVYIY